MNPSEFTGWWFTDATRQIACPKCNQPAGSYCRTPSGRLLKGRVPHAERTSAIAAEVGSTEPWQGANALAAWKLKMGVQP